MKQAYLVLHSAIVLAGLTGLFGKLIQLNEVMLVFYRLLIAAALLLAVICFTQPSSLRLPWRAIVKIVGVGVVLMAHWIFFYGSIKYSNISIGVVCFCLTGFFTALLAPIINQQKISLIEVFLSLLTVCGISLIFSFDAAYRFGILLGIISAILSAFATIFNEKLIRTYSAYSLTCYELVGGFIGVSILLPGILYFYPTNYLLPSWQDVVYLLILAGLCTVLMQILLNKALQTISAFTVSLSLNLEPIYSILIAFVIFNEHKQLNMGFYLGLTFILGSLALQMYRVSKLQSRVALRQLD